MRMIRTIIIVRRWAAHARGGGSTPTKDIAGEFGGGSLVADGAERGGLGAVAGLLSVLCMYARALSPLGVWSILALGWVRRLKGTKLGAGQLSTEFSN